MPPPTNYLLNVRNDDRRSRIRRPDAPGERYQNNDADLRNPHVPPRPRWPAPFAPGEIKQPGIGG